MDKFTPYFGFYLSQHCREGYGVAAINVFSDYMVGFFLQKHPGLMEPLRMRMPREVELQEWLKQLPVEEIVGIICESDSGLADAEKFGVMLGLRNHDGINEARRNKYQMVETVGKAGLAVVRQRLCHTPEEAVEFAKELGVVEESSQEGGDTSQTADTGTPVPIAAYHEGTDAEANTGSLGKATNVHHSTDTPMCIVKPIRGSGTDSVFLCKSQSEVEKAFNLIHGMPVFDSPREMHDSVLIQEFVSGTEYAIDIVSKNGARTQDCRSLAL
jgi:biotin carboxylase